MKTTIATFVIVMVPIIGIGKSPLISSESLNRIDWKRIEISWTSEGNLFEEYQETFALIDRNTGEIVIPEISFSYQIETFYCCGDPMWAIMENLRYTLFPPLDYAVDFSAYLNVNLTIPDMVQEASNK